MNDTTSEPVDEDAIFIDTRKPIIRWLPLIIALALAVFQAFTLVTLAGYSFGADERIFYPLLHIRDAQFHVALTGVTMLLVLLGGVWVWPQTIGELNACLISLLLCIGLWGYGYWEMSFEWSSTELTHVDSMYYDSHVYHLLIQHYSTSESNYETYIIYRCDRFGLFCRPIHREYYSHPIMGSTAPPIDASNIDAVRLVYDADGNLYIEYPDLLLPIPDPEA